MSNPLQQLRVTKNFAEVFIDEARNQIDGSSRGKFVPRAALQLRQALDDLQDSFHCANPQCGHRYDLHEGTSGGFCVHGQCGCLAFKEAE